MAEKISIFNIGEHAAEMNAGMFPARYENKLFDPKLKDASDVKVFVIRLIPLVADPAHSMISKRYYALNDQAGTIMFDSRTTFNNPAAQYFEFCPVSDMWAKFRNSKDPNVQERANLLRLQTAAYAYIQVVKFPGEDALNGQILPMRLPVELVKTLRSMAQPNEQEIALGTLPVQPFDIFGGKNIKCTITGKTVDGSLMRSWKVEPDGGPCEVCLPLGPNNTMIPVSKASQEAILNYLTEQETEDLNDKYGYHEPTIETKIRVKCYLQSIVQDIPALQQIAAGYFPELQQAVPLDQNVQAPADAQQAPQAPAQPAPQIIIGGDPMAAQAPAQPATQAPAQPAPQAPAQPAPQAPAQQAPQAPAAPAQAAAAPANNAIPDLP